jgi:hypothetical protein
MKASEFIFESEELDEYKLLNRYDPTWMINRGNHPAKKSLKIIQTPLTDYNVRYSHGGMSTGIHDYYLYDKKTDNCIGAFSIEETDDVPRSIKRLLATGVQAVIPHMGLGPSAQRKGISTQAYSTFLRGGPWVFITDHHTVGASKLWDSLVKGDIISLYVSQQGKILDKPDSTSYRLLGPRSRFKSA